MNVAKSSRINSKITNRNNSNSKSPKNTAAIVILVIVGILLLFFVYTQIKSYYHYKKTSPYFIKDIHDCIISKRIDSYKVPLPSDGQYGTEFTYALWMFIDDSNFSNRGESVGDGGCSSDSPLMKHVFHKGSNDFTIGQQGELTHYPLLQSPGVFLYPNTNKLNININTFANVKETCDIGNLPLNAWFHVTIELIGNSIDVYINGELKKRQKLEGVVKLNYGDLFVTNFQGYRGYMSKFRYFNYAISPVIISNLFNEGPSNVMETSSKGISEQQVAQLSNRYWYNVGFPNSFGNPQYKQNANTTV